MRRNPKRKPFFPTRLLLIATLSTGTRGFRRRSITNGSRTTPISGIFSSRTFIPAPLCWELGCGNSQLSDEMCKDGISDITCIDLSSVAVEKMRIRLSSKGFADIKVMVADMLDLPFEENTFDVVIEKGTMDVLFVDSGDPWNPRPEIVSNVKAMLEGVHRVLKPDGIFISISFGQPHFRRALFEAPEFTWSMEWKTFGDGFHYFFYVLRKGKSSSDKRLSEKPDVPSICLLQDELEGEDFLFRTNLDSMER